MFLNLFTAVAAIVAVYKVLFKYNIQGPIHILFLIVSKMGKTDILVPNQVQYKPGYTATEDGYIGMKLKIWKKQGVCTAQLICVFVFPNTVCCFSHLKVGCVHVLCPTQQLEPLFNVTFERLEKPGIELLTSDSYIKRRVA